MHAFVVVSKKERIRSECVRTYAKKIYKIAPPNLTAVGANFAREISALSLSTFAIATGEARTARRVDLTWKRAESGKVRSGKLRQGNYFTERSGSFASHERYLKSARNFVIGRRASSIIESHNFGKRFSATNNVFFARVVTAKLGTSSAEVSVRRGGVKRTILWLI